MDALISNPKIKTGILAGFLAAIGIFYFATIREGHSLGSDFAMYILHAKKIAEGGDYRETGYIYNPDYPSMGPKTYPPLFPIALAPVYHWFGLNLTAMKAASLLFFIISLGVLFQSFKGELLSSRGVIFIPLLGLNPYVWEFKDDIRPEFLFLLWTYLSLYLIHRYHASDQAKRTDVLSAMIVGLSIYLAYGTRSIGIILIPCLFVYDLLRFRRPVRFTLIATLLFFFFAALQALFLHCDSGYWGLLKKAAASTLFIDLITWKLLLFPKSFFVLWENGYSLLGGLLLSLTIFLFSVAGLRVRLMGKITVYEIFLLLYLIVIWPIGVNTRFLIPIVPLCLFYALVGAEKIFSSANSKKAGFLFPLIIAAVFISYAGKYSRQDFGPISGGVNKKETIELFNHIQRNTEPGDIFVFRKPRVITLYTGRSAAVYHQMEPESDSHLWTYFQSIGASYLVVSPEIDKAYWPSFIKRHRERLDEVFSNGDFKIYKIRIDNVGSNVLAKKDNQSKQLGRILND